MKLIREGGKYHLLFKPDGEVNEKIPKTIKDALGTPAEDIVETKREEITRRENKIKELQASRETASENQREQIDANIEEQQSEISRLEAENERIEGRMSLRDRVKLIFKNTASPYLLLYRLLVWLLVISWVISKKGWQVSEKELRVRWKISGKKLERFCLVWLELLQVSFSKQQVKRLVFLRNTLGYWFSLR